MRIMALDYGTKRIGVAISDEQATMAHPLETIPVRADQSHMDQILKVIADYDIARIVVGLPYHMDGSLSDMGRLVMDWARELHEFCGLEVELFDERLTTSQAHDLLLSHNVRGRKRKQVIDKIAASLILKEYLDTQAP